MAFAELGWHVEAICWYGHPMAHTRSVRRIHHYRPLRPVAALSTAIARAAPDLVVPCDDRAVSDLHALHEQARASGDHALALLIERSLGNPRAAASVRGRAALIAVAREEGVRAPLTLPVVTSADLRAALGQVGLPAMLKADDSWGGLGVAVATTPAEADTLFAQLSGRLSAVRVFKRLLVDRDPFWLLTWLRGARPRVNVQAFVPGRPANCILACWNGEVIASIHVDVLHARHANGPATIVRVCDHPEMAETARRIARRLGLSGFCGLDFIIEDETGAAHLIEMNQRMTPLGHLALGEGRDPVAALTARHTGRDRTGRPAMTTDNVIAFFPTAWQLEPDSRELSNCYHDVPWSDPGLVRELVRRAWPKHNWLARIDWRKRTRPARPVVPRAPASLLAGETGQVGGPSLPMP